MNPTTGGSYDGPMRPTYLLEALATGRLRPPGFRAALAALAVLAVAATGCTSGAAAGPDSTQASSGTEVPHFATLPVGSPLPSDAACAASVRPAPEVRPENLPYNQTMGVGPTTDHSRVSGAFTGTTDEILQWAACKWGIDEDVVRAQVALESWWYQTATGDPTSDLAACHPLLRGESSTCPESVGLGQVRFAYHSVAFAHDNAIASSAYNVDYTYSFWRSCYDGSMTWVRDVEGGSSYAAGDTWACVGLWYSGRWLTPPARSYIDAVQQNLSSRVWETSDFLAG